MSLMSRFVWAAVLWSAVSSCFAQAAVQRAGGESTTPSPLPPPDPPKRYDPWTPPATELPGEAVSAVVRLFEIGLPDPRACEYRAVTVTTRPHGRGPVETRAWLIPSPDRDKVGRPVARYAICWNGHVHPVTNVGDPAVVADDAEAAMAVLRGPDSPRPAYDSVRVDAPHPVRIALLLRLGEVALAEEFYAAGYEGPAKREADRFALDCATGWARAAYLRLVAAHAAGDHVLGMSIARYFERSGPEVIAEAARRGVADPVGRYGYLSEAPALAAVQRARQSLAETRPRAIVAGRAGYPHASEYARALMEDVDHVALPGPRWAGGLYFDLREEPSLREVIGLGEEAVSEIAVTFPPSQRVTRIVDRSGPAPYVVTTADAATFVIREILQGGKSSPESFAAFWEATRGKSAWDRWKALLAEEDAPPQQWLVAGKWLLFEHYPLSDHRLRKNRPPEETAAVRALVVERFRRTLARYDEAPTFSGLATARKFGEVASAADPQAAQPALQELLSRMRAAILDPPAYAEGETPHAFDAHSLGDATGRLTTTVAKAGNRRELQRYADWLRELPANQYHHFPIMLLSPLWEFPDDPAITEAGEWFFEGTDSPWPARLDAEPNGPGRPPVPPAALVRSLLDPLEVQPTEGATPALKIPAFRRLVSRLLHDERAAGETWVEPRADGTPMVQIRARIVGASEKMPPRELGDIVEGRQTLRVADLVAWTIRARQDRSRSTTVDGGVPAFSPVWTVSRRDAALAEFRAWLREDRPPVEAPRP